MLQGKPIVDIVWLLICSGLVFLMQAGFLCLETGLTRSKNNINVAIKNLADFGLSTVLFWLFGFSLMFGTTWRGLVGHGLFAPDFGGGQVWLGVFFLFQVMFCGTAVTILSGAVAERLRFETYLILTALLSGLTYPILGHWIWHGVWAEGATGWLEGLGFVDLAGSTVVHSVGGWSALAILLVVGARRGRFNEDGTSRRISGANLPLAALGVLLLYVGWIGFNGGSLFTVDGRISRVVANTLLAGSAGMIATLLWGLVVNKKAEVDAVMNGCLAGLVSITAGAHVMSSGSAVLVGIL
ncbi:MAG TPA: hypothetical protein VLL52_14655, partial [Anaerolineae bacterium]|nr:hypothetical protein [Anaerolineae bacterium]